MAEEMEKLKKELDEAVKQLKNELVKNFNGKNFERISETANYILMKASEIDYHNAKCEALNILGGACFNICDYAKSQSYYIESINIAENIKNEEYLAAGYNNIGIIFFTLEQFDKALEYYLKALEIKLKSENKASISTAYNNIGLIYNVMKDQDKALEYFNRSLELDSEANNRFALCRDYNNIGLAYDEKEEYDKALDYFSKSYDISRDEKNSKWVAASLLNLSKTYLNKDDPESALVKALEGENIAIIINSNSHLLRLYKLISEAYKKKCDFKNSLEYYEKYIDLKESIYKDESKNKIIEMQIKYESEKKQRDAEVFRLRNEELSILNTTKDKFFRIIHHDLLNPFTAIHTTSEFLDKYYEKIDEKKRRNYIKGISESSERLLKLMDNLFEWVKTQTGQLDHKPEEVNIRDIVDHNLSLLKNNIHGKDINVELKLPKKCSVLADRNMTDTIIRNLIANAIKFTHNKGNISISGKCRNGIFSLTVEDDGTGMTKDQQNRLFKVSETFTTPGTNDEKGTGLGLILVKEFLDINNGNISVKSRPGKGSSFTISLQSPKN
ncbi:MAG TPA: tetratricopeptide repeat-containing sensor histidine kinase [Clostridiales bacterium]|nr:tetratricopeptide repeat-containing sensor histidine kinase [Clostridiales bacterium]HQP70746.1 tetratricopeptide repeat-containing sensor histidine kinase [Clostridiales bacterium]